uniref:CENP-V/GFA domain-containing protein n=1 Tax=Entomoneis paludosa TaxID=265537 RepID=A0A7S3DNU2_9STRA|eukprot:CAMPEP_0172454076 /NCGR_PEP_ID=MMETSP1065-20121228/11167_1 /TAXON_ID=265537 /ORGANISM="Amphiprora paludosa, Strain CCMP125" /LENGTH=383 /DNA_ID=CAMNT_0013206337 /DNA_START=95 /DNA_END=1246 /DNA_ORIENTATION=-
MSRPGSNTLVSSSSLGTAAEAFGWTTTVALGLLLLQWVGTHHDENDAENNNYDFSQWLTSRTLLQLIGLKQSEEQKKDDDGTVPLHRGSCQCGSITFKLTPARRVPVLQNYTHLGKLQYPTARVPSDQLQLTSGKHLWNTYHVSSQEDGSIWAFSFCRSCATQLLHATEGDQSSLFVNVSCFAVPEQEKASTKKNKKEKGTPACDDASVGTKTSVATALPYFADPRLFSEPSPSMRADPAPRGAGLSRGTSWRRQQQQSPPELVTYTEGSSLDEGEGDADDHIGQNIVMDPDCGGSISSRSSVGHHHTVPYGKTFGSRVATSVTGASSSASFSTSASISPQAIEAPGASLDYNVSSSREAMLYNMRKHLRDSHLGEEKKMSMP